MLKHCNDKSFEQEVLKSENVTLVDFYASWCGPCMMLAPILEKLSTSRADFDIVKVNVDESPLLSRKYNIDSIPALMVFKDGKILEQEVGYKGIEEIEEMISKHM